LTWPPTKRFPAIDIIRLAAAKAHSEVSKFKSGDLGIIDILIEGAEMKENIQGRKELDTNALLVLRTFVNLFDGEEGISLMTSDFKKVEPQIHTSHSRFWMRRRLGSADRVVNLLKLRLPHSSSSMSFKIKLI
jgi:PUL domain